jgi:hypothetical protein
MSSIQSFLESWPTTEYGKNFLAEATLKVPDPAIFFYDHPDDETKLKVVALPRLAVRDMALSLIGGESKFSNMLGDKAESFYWCFYASNKECLLLAYACLPSKRNLS